MITFAIEVMKMASLPKAPAFGELVGIILNSIACRSRTLHEFFTELAIPPLSEKGSVDRNAILLSIIAKSRDKVNQDAANKTDWVDETSGGIDGKIVLARDVSYFFWDG